MRHFSVNNTNYVVFEPDEETIAKIAIEAGFRVQIERQERVLRILLLPQARKPMFFDAADTRQVARLAAARTFVNGLTGVVYNTPFVIESFTGPGVSVRLGTEMRWDQARKFPQGACETSVMVLFQQLVQDLAASMVGVCGMPQAAVQGPRPKVQSPS
jgi:hypothetical protein